MTRAIELANTVTYEDHTSPNPIVGCVIVDPTTNEVIGEGYHPKAGEPHGWIRLEQFAVGVLRGAGRSLLSCDRLARNRGASVRG